MATSNEVQTQLGTSGRDPTIIRTIENATAGTTLYYVTGGASFPGKARWVSVTYSFTDVFQASAIRTALLA